MNGAHTCKMENLSRVPVLVLLLTLGVLPVTHADSSTPFPPPENSDPQSIGSVSGVLACGNAFEQGVSSGSRCFMEQMVNGILMDKTTHFANAYGKRLFGEHFSLANRLTYSQVGGGLSGEVDAVVPLSALAGFIGFGGKEAGEDAGAENGAFFSQQGVTSWTDGQGLRRYDMRYGVVRRVNLSDEPGANVVGLSTFFQQNLEYGHGRVVTGFDYDGAWGRSTFNYFQPTTGWQDARSRAGYEERALAGMELSVQLQPTSTLGLETALTRWEARDGAGRWGNRCPRGLFLATPCLGENQDRLGWHRDQYSEPVGFRLFDISPGRPGAYPQLAGAGPGRWLGPKQRCYGYLASH